MLVLVSIFSLCFTCFVFSFIVFFFCKQKTAYEMRISDWSSDVCSSDLASMKFSLTWLKDHLETTASLVEIVDALNRIGHEVEAVEEIGRASCRERVCQYV